MSLSTTPTAPSHRRLLSLDDAADRAGVHRKTLRRWVSSGLLTGYRAGPRLVRIDAGELDSFLSQQIPTAGSHDAACVAALVDAAPPLTPAQRDRLAALLRGGGTDG